MGQEFDDHHVAVQVIADEIDSLALIQVAAPVIKRRQLVEQNLEKGPVSKFLLHFVEASWKLGSRLKVFPARGKLVEPFEALNGLEAGAWNGRGDTTRKP